MTVALAATPLGNSTAQREPRHGGADHVPQRHVRLDGVDAARGVALIGMMVIHVLPDENPATGGPAWTYVISAGNASALFALLAGVSIAFTSGRARVGRDKAAGAATSLATRAAVIGFIGLALGYTDAELAAVILPYYAVMFVLAIPLVFLPTWGVAATGLVLIAATPVVSFLARPHILGPSDSTYNVGFGDLVTRPGWLLTELGLSGEFPALVWISYMCVGLFIGRLTLQSSRVASRILITGCVAAALAHVASSVLLYNYGGLQRIWATTDASTASETIDLLRYGGDGNLPATTWWWLTVVEPHSGTPLDLLSTIGIAAAVLAALLLTDHLVGSITARLVGLGKTLLAAAGKMTLTFYTLHVMFINSVHDTYVPTTSFILQVVAVIVLGVAWQASAGRGPLEALTAAVTQRARRFVTSRRKRARS